MKEILRTFINNIISEREDSTENEPIKELKSEFSLRDDISFTSLELASLTVMIEDEYDIDIFEDGLVTTVGEILIILEESKK